MRSILHGFAGVFLALAALAALAPAHAADIQLVVNVFPGMQTLPLYAAQDRGLFAKRGIAVDIQPAPSSDALRANLAQGRIQLAHAGIDNSVYMAESGAGDAVIVAGGDNGMNELIVEGSIHSFADLRGKAMLVDAVNTAYAFQGYRMLELHGLKRADYTVIPKGATPLRFKALVEEKAGAAAMLYPPWSALAERQGFHSLGTAVASIGPYQATGVFVLRGWAQENRALLVRYLQAIIEATRWAKAPKNKDAAIDLIAARLKIDRDIALRSYPIGYGKGGGVAKDARFDREGFRNVLKLRAAYGDTPAKPRAPDSYIDLSYYRAALKVM